MSSSDARIAGIAENLAGMAEQLRELALVADAHVAVRITDVRDLLDALEAGRSPNAAALARLCEATGREYLRTKVGAP